MQIIDNKNIIFLKTVEKSSVLFFIKYPIQIEKNITNHVEWYILHILQLTIYILSHCPKIYT